MLIQPDEMIGTTPAERMKEIALHCIESQSLEIGRKKVQRVLLCSENDAIRAMAWLRARKMICRIDGKLFLLPTQMARLLRARVGVPVPRSAADIALREVVRIAQSSHADGWVTPINRVAVFGSYLSNALVLGDLDVAVTLGKRNRDSGLHPMIEINRVAEFVSVDLLDDVVQMGSPYKIIFDVGTR